MSYEQIEQLEPQRLGERVSDPQNSLKRIARLAPLPASYLEWLANAGGAIVFARGALFSTEETSPLNDKRGYQSLEMLFGPGTSDDSILGEHARYQDELPDGFVPIGEAPGGNLICINEQGGVYLWDHEGTPNNSYWRVCDSVETLLNGLRPDDSPIGDDDGIVESESRLDF